MFQFESMNDLFMMDGHGAYVWACYAITAIALGVLVWVPYVKKKVLIIQLKRQQRIDNQPQ
jgi:heme exporter protein D